MEDIEVADLIAATPKVDCKNLKIGEVIKLGKAKVVAVKEEVEPVSAPTPTPTPITFKEG